MTDYGQFYDGDGKLLKLDSHKEAGIPAKKSATNKSKSCSTNPSLVKFVKHVDALRAVLKSASDDGFCLDELIEAGAGK
jgi:hypothetical protein